MRLSPSLASTSIVILSADLDFREYSACAWLNARYYEVTKKRARKMSGNFLTNLSVTGNSQNQTRQDSFHCHWLSGYIRGASCSYIRPCDTNLDSCKLECFFAVDAYTLCELVSDSKGRISPQLSSRFNIASPLACIGKPVLQSVCPINALIGPPMRALPCSHSKRLHRSGDPIS